MKVTIVGAGNMGRGSPRARWQADTTSRSSTAIPSRRRSSAARRARSRRTPSSAARSSSSRSTNPGIEDAAREYADRLAGNVVVDITDPVDTQT